MLLPAMADITMVIGELMLLHESDRRGSRFALGWVIFFFGLASALAANASFGWRAGHFGGVITWTAAPVALALIAVGMVSIVKRADQRAGEESGDANPQAEQSPSRPGQLPSPVPGSAEEAAEAWLRGTVLAGNPAKAFTLVTRFGISRKTATELHRRVLAETTPPPEPVPDLILVAPPAELVPAGSANGHHGQAQ